MLRLPSRFADIIVAFAPVFVQERVCCTDQELTLLVG